MCSGTKRDMNTHEKMPAVSVVVPVYNSENTVEATIESLFGLKYPEAVELIFVDNRSTDRTSQILGSYLPRIRVLREPKPGQSAARNHGIREARHSVVAFTDADCVVDSEWLTELVPPLGDPRIGISGGNIGVTQPCNSIQRFGEMLHDHERPINAFKPPYAITMNWASRRSVLLDAGGFDETMRRGEDCDLSYRIIQAGYGIVYRHGAVVAHRNRSNLTGLFREGFADGFHSVKVLKKHRIFFRQFGHRSANLKGYATLTKTWIRCVSKNAEPHTLYDATFNSGKKAGKVLGSLRFGCIEL
jgi:glycosyltransferase involved in cell wall biosynthesis